MAKAGDAVKKQKAESELLAAVLAKGGDPTSVPVPFALRYLQAPITLNQGLLAGINGSIGAPQTPVVLGPEHGSSHHAPWGEPGQRVTCLEAGRMALRAELANGLHGGREPWGYAGMYGCCYSLAAAHPDPECREIGRKLLAGWLAVFYLLRGYEMGCRAGVEPEGNAVAILDLMAGREPKIGKQDWQAAARIFRVLMPVLDLPKIRNDDEAAAVLRDSGVRCLLGWTWVDYPGDGVFGAAVLDYGGCIKKGTGEGVTMIFDGTSARPVESLPTIRRRTLTLDSSGLSLSGPWSLPEPAPPPVEPGEEEPLPEEPGEEPILEPAGPTPEQIEFARELTRQAKSATKAGMTARQALFVRQTLQDVLALLAGREPKP